MSVKEQKSLADILRLGSNPGRDLETEVNDKKDLEAKLHKEWKKLWR